jgi:hypothetical protein
VFGFHGALLAIPMAAIIQLIFERIYLSTNESFQGLYADRINIQKLQNRSEATVRAILETSRKDQSPFGSLPQDIRLEIGAIALELDELLKKTRIEDGA